LGADLKLVRDVLDKKLIDREQCDMGRVSGLVMRVGERSQPHISHILIDGSTLWTRVHPALGRLSTRLAKLWGPRRNEPVRIPWSRVVSVGKDIKVDVKARDTGALDWEIWIAQHIIEHIPGGGHKEQEE
jgi:sporulation protein YlmC with PRC-barrel domain